MYSYSCADTVSLKEYISLIDAMGLNFTAEAKTAEIPMPFQGDYTQQDFAQQLVATFDEADINPDRVWLQSFLPEDIFFWLDNYPAYGAQAIYLDERGDVDQSSYEAAVASLPGLAARGVRIVSPDIWQLVAIDNGTRMVPSSYAIAAKGAGLQIIAWSFERSGPLIRGGGAYYQSVAALINNDGDEFTVIDVIAQQVGAVKIFADWAATVTYYANCVGLD